MYSLDMRECLWERLVRWRFVHFAPHVEFCACISASRQLSRQSVVGTFDCAVTARVWWCVHEHSWLHVVFRDVSQTDEELELKRCTFGA